MATTDISINLDASGLNSSTQSAIDSLTHMRGSLGSLARELQRSEAQLRGGADAVTAWRIQNANATDAQRATLNAVHQHNIALAQLRRRIEEHAAAETRRRTAVENTLSGLRNQTLAIGRTAAQMQLMELRSNGATAAQIRQAHAMQNLIAAHERINRSQGSGIGNAAIAAIGIGSVAGIAQMMDKWTEFNNRLKLVTASSQELQTAQSELLNIATRTGQNLDGVASVYQRFAANAKQLGISQQDTLAITETVNKAIAVSGASAESASAALTQFGQALASGALRGEEFNSVMENAPGLAQAIAKGLDVPVGKLRTLANTGQLTADVLVKALQRASSSVDADFAKTNMTISQSMVNVKTRWVEFIGKSGESSGAVKVLSGSLNLLANNIKPVVTLLTAWAGVKLVSWLVTSAASLAQNVAAHIALRQAATTSAIANGSNALAISRAGTAAQIAGLQVTGFSGSLRVLAASARVSAASLHSFASTPAAAGLGKWALGLTAVAAGFTGLASAINAAQGKSADNWINGMANSLVGLDNETESIGTKLYDWLHPIDQATQKLQAQQKVAAQLKETLGDTQQSTAEKIAQAGSVAAYKAENTKLDDLKKSLSDSVVKYREQNEQLGKSKEQLEKLRLEQEKAAAIIKARAEIEKSYAQYTGNDKQDLINKDLAQATRQIEQNFQAATRELDKYTQAQAAAAAATKAREAVESSINGLQEKLKLSYAATQDEAERMKLAMQGASAAQLKQVEALQTAVALQEKQNKVNQTLEDLRQELQRVGKSAAEIKLMDLKNAGATAEQLAEARALLDATAAKEASFKTIEGAGNKMDKAADKMLQANGESGIDAQWAKYKAQADEYNATRRYTDPLQSLAKAGIDPQTGEKLDKAAAMQERIANVMQAVATLQGNATQQQTASMERASTAMQAAAQSLAPPATQNSETVFSQAVSAFSAAVGNFAGMMGKQEAMQHITLDFRLPDGKALSGKLFAESSFVEQLKKVSQQAMFETLQGAARAKS